MCSSNIESIINDLRLLYQTSQQDYSEEKYWNARRHCDEFNRILNELKQYCPGKVSDFDEIQFRPLTYRALIFGSPSSGDMPTFGRIVYGTARLYERIIGGKAEASDK